MNRKIPLSKKNQREMSAFIGNGLLLDYIQDKLDRQRKTAVENYLLFSRDAQLEKEKIEKAMAYCQYLRELNVQPNLLQKIESQQNYLQVFLQKSKLKQLPAGIRWGIEAIGAMILILILLIFTPWQNIIQKTIQKQQDNIILAEVDLTKNKLAQSKDTSDGDFVDEEIINTQDQAKSKIVDKGQVLAETETTKTNSVIPEKDKQKTVTQLQTSQIQKEIEQNKKVDTLGHEGYLFRGDLQITNINASGSKITAKITELGGRKAGEVNLGWKKGTSSLYYHFTIPETKYKELLAFLNSYGKINLIKEKHSRVMPEGIVRVILNVNEAQK